MACAHSWTVMSSAQNLVRYSTSPKRFSSDVTVVGCWGMPPDPRTVNES